MSVQVSVHRYQTSTVEFDTRRKIGVEGWKVSNPCLQGWVRPHLSVSQSVTIRKPKNVRKQKTGDRIAAISRLVPGAGQFSNSLYANLDEFRALKESLQREGIFDETWETLVIPRRGASSTLPYRP